MTDLFPDLPEQLSPYAQWMADNNIKTFESSGVAEPWFACQSEISAARHYLKFGLSGGATGKTEDEAIASLCAKMDIPVYGAKREGGE